MIPIRDTIPSKNYPIVNTILIGINIAVFFIQMSQGVGLGRFIYTYGLVPARFSIPDISSYFTFTQQLFSLISFMFLHGGVMHLMGNLWMLYIFGDNVEDHLGSFYYLIFYLLCGLMSGLFHLLLNYHSTIPTIGASGAIAGVMGAYFILYPNSKILTLIPIVFIPWFVEIPAVFFLGFWFVMQVFNAAFSSAMASGIAWWAHIGGFVFGIVCLKLFNVLPSTSISGSLKSASFKKRTTPRFQFMKGSILNQDNDLYDEIHITPYEATAGAKKTINIAWGFHKRFYHVTIPPGTRDKMVLRLKGIGKVMEDGQPGDLLLKVRIQQPW